MPTSPRRALSLEAALRAHALGYPDAEEAFPWGERAIKVRGKAFLFMRAAHDGVSFSVKLPHSGDEALALPFVEPTGYGLGKHGWITAAVQGRGQAELAQFEGWIDESYRTVAPKQLVARLDAGRSGPRIAEDPVKLGAQPRRPGARRR